MSTLTKAKQAERDEALENLRELVKPGDTLHTVLRNVSRSGMSRDIDVYIIQGNKPRWLTYWASKVLGYRMPKGDAGMRVGGCGMDMGFHVVYGLSRALYPTYTCTGDHCPSNAHVNSPRYERDGKMLHHDGYALNHKWL